MRQRLTYRRDAVASKLRAAVKGGAVSKPSVCERCGREPKSTELHGHHEDYTKPYEVWWLCIRCHAAVHNKNGDEWTEARRAAMGAHPRGRSIPPCPAGHTPAAPVQQPVGVCPAAPAPVPPARAGRGNHCRKQRCPGAVKMRSQY